MKKLLIPILCGFSLTSFAEEETSKRGELIRSLKGTEVDESGNSKGEVSVMKGESYEVASEGVGSVVLRNADKLIKVPSEAVKVTDADDDDAVGSSLRIVSAKLGFLNDRRYEVKQEIKKIVKKHLDRGPITTSSPVEIPISDLLLRAKAKAATYTSRQQPNGTVTVYRRPEKLYLLITYEFEGKRMEKSGKEGTTIKIP
jgi:hypothetical protein